MEFSQLQDKAFSIQARYKQLNLEQKRETWTATEYAQALVSDSSDLMKLLMVKNGHRHPVEDLNQKIEHEASDCLWAIMVTAKELGIDLEQTFLKSMGELEKRIQKSA